MSSDLDRVVIQMFLGEAVAAAWSSERPELLLGLREGAALPDAAVLAALQQKQSEIMLHPLATSPQGEHFKRLLSGAASKMMLRNSSTPQRLPTIGQSVASGTAASAGSAARVDPPVPPQVRVDPTSLYGVARASPPSPLGLPQGLISNPSPPAQAAQTRGAKNPASVTRVAAAATNPPVMLTPGQAVFVREARMVLLQGGGLNPATMTQITALAGSRGIDAQAVPMLVQLALGVSVGETVVPATAGPVQGGSQVPAQDAPELSPDERRIVQTDPTMRVLAWLIGGGVVVVLFLGSLIWLLANVTTGSGSGAAGSGGGAPAQTAGAAASGSGATSADGSGGGGQSAPARALPELTLTPPSPDQPVDGADLIKRLTAAAARMNDKPGEAIKAFRLALGGGSGVIASWDKLNASQRVAIGEAIVDVVYRASGDAKRLEEVLGAFMPAASISKDAAPLDADQVRPVGFASGVLWRLSRERELPPEALKAVGAKLGALWGGSRPAGAPGFATGAASALSMMPMRIIAPGFEPKPQTMAVRSAVLNWVQVVRNVFSEEPGKAEGFIAEVLDTLMRQAPEPEDHRPSFDAITLIAASMKWENGDQARSRLVVWLADPAVSNAKLNLVTGTLVQTIKLDGLDTTLVLSTNATPDQRAGVREGYVTAWNLSQSVGAGTNVQAWTDASTIALGSPNGDTGDDLAFAVLAAQFNQAAVFRTVGKTDLASLTLQSLQTPTPIKLGATGNPEVVALIARDGSEDSWASRFLTGDRSLPVRLTRIKEIEDRAGGITQLDADVLAETAFSGSPPELSNAALKALTKLGSSPLITHAMLKAFTKASRREAIGRAVEQVTFRTIPPVYSDRWSFTIRKALVERLLEQIAGVTWASREDDAAVRLAEAYASMAQGQGVAAPASEQASDLLLLSSQQYVAALRAHAGTLMASQRLGLSLDQIERRGESRRLVAFGPIQRFAAEQTIVMELLAFIVAAERPELADKAAEEIRSVTLARQNARDVFQQVRLVEQSMVRLWLMRFGIPSAAEVK
ncbi:MAG: hypothetical protein IBJ18_00375 [Phycisphaerales bacterium]|nr:hypothetical protein [Phycisphaerales bacterium]